MTVVLADRHPAGVDKARSVARSAAVSLKKYDRGSSLNPERGGNLLRTPDPVRQIGGGVRAFCRGHEATSALRSSAVLRTRLLSFDLA
jgi:hypothetical protein